MARNRERPISYLDRHHIIHDRSAWESREDARRIRRIEALVPMIDRTAHEEIHKKCPSVPLLGYQALQMISRDMLQYRNNPDTLEVVDGLLVAIDKAGSHPRAHKIETQLAGLAIEAIETQLPYIRSALL